MIKKPENWVTTNLVSRTESILLIFLVGSLPFSGNTLFNIGKYPVGRVDLLLSVLLFTVFFIGTILYRRSSAISHIVYVMPLAIATVLNLLNSYFQLPFSIAEFATTSGQLMLGIALFVAIPILLMSSMQIRQILQIWISIPFVVSLYGIYQSFARTFNLPFAVLSLNNPTFNEFTATGDWGNLQRVSSVFSEPSYFGVYLVAPLLMVFFAIAFNFDREMFFSRKMNLLVLVTLAGATFLSFSKGAFFTLGIVFILLVLDKGFPRTVNKSILALVIIFIVFSVVLQLVGLDVLSAVNETAQNIVKSGSLIRRLGRQSVSLQIWKDHPVLGIGLNQTQFFTKNYILPEWTTGNLRFVSSHNMWIQALTEMGLIGFVALLAMWLFTLNNIRTMHNNSKSNIGRALSLVLFYILISEVISATHTFMIGNLIRWLNLALVLLVANNFKEFETFLSTKRGTLNSIVD